MGRQRLTAAFALPIILVLAACTSGTAATTAPSTTTPSSAPSTDSSTPPASPDASDGATTGATVEAKEVGSNGTILVAGSNGMTVYAFTKDTKDNGKSACSGDCAVKWPALTVAAGGAPTPGPGVTGTLATITRDDGALQVTYNGLPLYFFQGDSKAGDSNGVYTNWEAVKP